MARRAKEMVRIYELRELDKRMEKFARNSAAKHSMILSDAILTARAEEDDKL